MDKVVENLGSFYLGKKYDTQQQKILKDITYYDAKDLCTHAVCLGMTGSGKTGLCISMLEEAIMDQIPVIAIDPKGDIANLMMLSPSFKDKDFIQWVDPSKAAVKGVSIESFAKKEAKKWQEGTTAWHQKTSRLQALKSASDINIYTPGSEMGLQISMLKSLNKPQTQSITEINQHAEHLVEGILTLMGEKVEPQSPKFVYLTSTLVHLWNEQNQVTLPTLIREIQNPSQSKIGVMDIDQFMNEKQRLSLAMKLNALVASPSFSLWSQGESLDIQKLLWNEKAKPKVNIFSIAHLSDEERMFFVSNLLEEIIFWMRKQSGTSSLRALLYMDEIFGFLPPVENPPSKKAFLTLLKQARAYGLGLVLASQNPADLDYKALSNIGTWFLGRLQTKQDQNKVLEGLQTLSQTSNAMTQEDYQSILGKLPSRVFIMKNIHEQESCIFHSRWAMSYLKGPVTLEEVSALMHTKKKKQQTKSIKNTLDVAVSKNNVVSEQPYLKGLKQYYAVSDQVLVDETIQYIPAVLAKAEAMYQNNTYQVAAEKTFNLLWSDGNSDIQILNEDALNIESEPEVEHYSFLEIPKNISNEKKRKTLLNKFKQTVYKSAPMLVYKDTQTKLISKQDETEVAFLARLEHVYKEKRDQALDDIKEKYLKKIQSLEAKKVKAIQKIDKEHAQYDQSKLSTAISLGTTVIGALLGRKVTRGSVGKLGTTLRRASRMQKEKGDVVLAKEDVKKYDEDLKQLNADMKKDLEQLKQEYQNIEYDLKQIIVRANKSNIAVDEVELLWLPSLKGKLLVDLTQA
ncbi:DUF87 domain-containing protein [bacterium]|nr:DUF87 domain-containing protein [bacterium]